MASVRKKLIVRRGLDLTAEEGTICFEVDLLPGRGTSASHDTSAHEPQPQAPQLVC